MGKRIIKQKGEKLRVLGYCSGSGNTVWKAYELQKKIENSGKDAPFEIVGIFADSKDAGAVTTAQKYGLPWAAIDIRKYCEDRGVSVKDLDVRADYDAEAMKAIKDFKADMILLAGYVWATTYVVLNSYPVVGVHPGDLAVKGVDGRRLLAGANGVKSAFKENMDHLRSSSYIATEEIDGGPILVRSPKIPVDYSIHENEEERFRYYLRLINEQGRYVGAITVLELASGNFTYDDEGQLCYKGSPVPQGICFEEWIEES